MGRPKNVNTKAVEARERKENTKKEKETRRQKEVEDAKWREDDPKVLKLQKKKQEEEEKRIEAQKRREELKKLKEEEEKNTAKTKVNKPTRSEIENMRKIEEKAQKKLQEKMEKNTPVPLENPNRNTSSGISANTLESAVQQLDEKPDLHPEKRRKAAYKKFEESRLPEIKEENPHLKLSQHKDILWKEWQKHPDNPMNQQ